MLLVGLGVVAGQPPSGYELMSDAVDADGNGVITLQEFFASTCGPGGEASCEPDALDVFTEIFGAADTDGNGWLSPEESTFLDDLADHALRHAAKDFSAAMSRSHDHLRGELQVLLGAELVHAAATPAPEGMTLRAFVAMARAMLAEPSFAGLDAAVLDWLPEVFHASDMDRDGELSSDESGFLAAGASLWIEQRSWRDHSDGMRRGTGNDDFRKADVEEDVSAGDFQEWDEEDDEDPLVGTLRELDLNGDGRIGYIEFMTGAESTNSGPESIKRAMDLFGRGDEDADGYLDPDELAHVLAIAFGEAQ